MGKAEEVLPDLYEKEGIHADVIVTDPPRKGCEEIVLETMVRMQPKRIVYVSCNSSTLARDLHYLAERGYETVKVQPVDMFAHTTGVECVALVVRKSGRYGLEKKVLEEIRELASEYGIKKVILFGSRARGDYRRTSDVDIAVTGGDVNAFTLAVDEETSTLLEYDVVNLDGSVQEELRTAIGEEGIVIYEEV